MNTPALELCRLEKTYDRCQAVAGVSFSIAPGECVGLLGPNGAGKSTILSLIAGILRPDRGEVLILGRKLKSETDALKYEVGLVPQDIALFEDLSARDNLSLFGALYHLSPAELSHSITDALALTALSERADDKIKTFSGGMKRRLNLAAALLHKPKLLLLDEPTVGVDPQSRSAIFDNIAGLRRSGITILYTTHYMEEVERLCDRVVILDHGKVVADDSLSRLKDRARSGQQITIELKDPVTAAWLPQLQRLSGVRAAVLQGNQLQIDLDDLADGTCRILQFLSQKGQGVLHFAAQRPTLESVFLALTGKQLRDL